MRSSVAAVLPRSCHCQASSHESIDGGKITLGSEGVENKLQKAFKLSYHIRSICTGCDKQFLLFCPSTFALFATWLPLMLD